MDGVTVVTDDTNRVRRKLKEQDRIMREEVEEERNSGSQLSSH